MKGKASFCGAWGFKFGDGYFACSDCIMMPGLKIPLLRFSMPLEARRVLNA